MASQTQEMLTLNILLNCFKRNHRLHNRILVVSEGGLQGRESKQNIRCNHYLEALSKAKCYLQRCFGWVAVVFNATVGV